MLVEEFEEGYCRRSGITVEEYKRWWVSLPCECDYEGCEGWAKVRNEPVAIEDHMRFYGLSRDGRAD